MPLTTVTVSIAVAQITGEALPYARVTFELTGVEIVDDVTVPQLTTVICAADGTGAIDVVSNVDQQYFVTITNQTGDLQYSGYATVPADDCDLQDIIELEATPGAGGIGQLAASTGAGLVGYAGGDDYAAGTVGEKLNAITGLEGAGIAGDGSDQSALIQAVLDAMEAAGGGTVAGTARTYGVGAPLVIPANVALKLSAHSTLVPTANVNVVRQQPGSHFEGRIDTTDFPGWNSVALDFDGDSNAETLPFRLHTPTTFDVEIRGDTTSGNGTAIKLHADGIAGARVMGVIGKARVYGFDTALWLRQTSTDNSKFVTGCILEIDAADSLRGILMDSSNVNGYDLDGNRIRMQLQPRTGTTVPAFALCGQQNIFDLTPWDWDTVVGASPYAITLQAGTRRTVVNTSCDPAHISNSSTDRDNAIFNAFAGAGLMAGELRGLSGDDVLRLTDTTLRLDNAKAISSRTADGSAEYDMLLTDASNLTFLKSMNVSGAGLVYDARAANGVHYWRRQGSNVMLLSAAGNLELQTAGAGLRIKEGSNAKQGTTSAMVGGSVTVPNTSVTASSRIFLCRNTAGGTLGHISYSKSVGVGFTITSSSGSETSSFDFSIFEPA